MINKTLLIISLILMISCNSEKDAKLYDQKYVDSVIAANTSYDNRLGSIDTQNSNYTPKSLAEISNEAYAKVQEHRKIVDENLAKEYVRDIYMKGDEIFIKQYNDQIGTSYFINKHLKFNCIYGDFYLIPYISTITDDKGTKYISIIIDYEKSISEINMKNSDLAVWFTFTNGKKIDYSGSSLTDQEINYFSKYKIKSLLIYDKTTNGVMVGDENLNTDYFIKCFKAIKDKDYRVQK